MLKRIKNNIYNLRREDDCIPYRDCSAHDAAAEDLAIAKSNLVTAKNNLADAEALKAELSTEKANTSALLGNYKSVYDTIMNTGSSIANPNNMGDLSGIINCLSSYGATVEESYNQAVSEVSRCEAKVAECETAVQQATIKLANTPCVWKCA